jgi:quinol-cytochrome oxidoreductase complex cytochrome b subunit
MIASTGFLLPWGHNSWFDHFSNFKAFEKHMFENLGVNKVLWYSDISNTFGVYTDKVNKFYTVHVYSVIIVWVLIVCHFRSFHKESRFNTNRPRLIWLRDDGKSVEETPQLKRLSEVFAIYHPVQIIRMVSTILFYLFYLKYFPDFTYFGDSPIRYEKYTFSEQVFILGSLTDFPDILIFL